MARRISHAKAGVDFSKLDKDYIEHKNHVQLR